MLCELSLGDRFVEVAELLEAFLFVLERQFLFLLIVVLLQFLIQTCVPMRLVYRAEHLSLLGGGTICLRRIFTAFRAKTLLLF